MNPSKKVAGQLLCMTDDRTEIPSGMFENRGHPFRDCPTTQAGSKGSETGDPRTSPSRGRYGKHETVPNDAIDAKGGMDFPAPAPRHSTSLGKALPSHSVTHKGRSRTTSAQRAGVISLEKKRAVSRGSERGGSRSR